MSELTQEQKDAIIAEYKKSMNADEAEIKAGEVEAMAEADKGSEVSIKLPENFDEIIAEKVAKASEAHAKAQKKFNFTNKVEDKAKMDKSAKVAEANKFIQLVAKGNYAEAAELETVKSRAKALDSQTSATAGVLVPEIFESEIFSNFDTFNEIIGDARVITTNQPGDVINYRQLDSKVTVYQVGELEPVTASNPSYTNPDLYFDKYMAEVVMSEELLEDTDTDLMSNLSTQINEKYAQTIQNRFVNSAVTNKEGLLQWAGTGVVTIGNAGSYLNTTFADLKQMQTAMSANYNKSEAQTGRYYMNVLTWDAIIDNTTTSGSAYSQYAINPFEGTPARAHGRDVRVVNEIATPTVTGTKFAIFADLSKHLIIARKRGLRMAVNTTGTASDGTNLNTEDARQLVMSARIGHVVVLPSGVFTLVS